MRRRHLSATMWQKRERRATLLDVDARSRDRRVVMVIQRFAPVVGGGELQLERLLPHLAAEGVGARVLTRAAPGTGRFDIIRGTEVRRSRFGGEGPAASLVYVATALADVARRRRATDVVHAHGALSPATIAVAATLLGIPAVVTPLGAGPPGDLQRLRRKRGGRVRVRLLVRRAHFVALSEELAAELLAFGVAPARIHTIPNGFDTARYRPADPAERERLRARLGLAPDRFTVVFAGRLHPVKNVETVISAVAKVREADLLIVGDGADRARLERLAHDLDVQARVRFCGERGDVDDVLRAADTFVLPSHGEGMSNALIEAMGCGLACVVAAGVGGAAQLVGTDRGVAVPATDVGAWAVAIDHLARDPEHRCALGEAAAHFVHESFPLERTAASLGAFVPRPRPATMKPRVVYVVSRFPKLSETFVVNEFAALASRFDLRLAALIHTREQVADDATAEATRRAWFVPRFAPSTLLAQVRWLRREPRRYLRMWGALLRDLPSGGFADAAKTLVVVAQAAKLAELATEAGTDHVHAHFANHPATAAWVVHRLTGTPFSFTAHANDLFRAPRFLDRKAAEARFVVAISEYNRRLLLERSPKARVRTVHCGVDTARFAPPISAGGTDARPSSGRHVICVARFEPKKGHRPLLVAFARLSASHPDVDLTLIGDGPERAAMEALAGSLGIADRVSFLGARPPDEVRTRLASASLFVLPAVRDETGRMDGIPVSLMEAMATGVPVVTTSVSGIPELVGDDGGIMLDTVEPSALRDAMARVLDDDVLARSLGTRGRERVTREFDLHVEAAKLAELFSASVRGGA